MSRRKIKKKADKFSDEEKKIIKMVLAGKDVSQIMQELGLDTLETVDKVCKLVNKIQGAKK